MDIEKLRETGQVRYEEWTYHADTGHITDHVYLEDGRVLVSHRNDRGRLHCQNGPALVMYDNFGNVEEKHYYLGGHQFSFE